MKNWLIGLFWIIVLIHLDPGGFKHSYLSSTESTIVAVFEFILLLVIFRYFYKNYNLNKLKFPFIKTYFVIILFWFVYYFLIFYGLNIRVEYPGFLVSLLRNFKFVFSAIIVLPIAYFTSFSVLDFLRYFVITSLIIGVAFLLSVFTPIDIIPTWSGTREAGGNLTRIFMYGYGIIFFIGPVFIAAFYLKSRMNLKVYISFGVLLAIVLLTIYRREMIALIEHLLIISFLIVFIQGKFILKSFSKILNVKTILILGFALFIIYVFVPGLLETGVRLTTDTLVDLGLIDAPDRRVEDVRLSLSGKQGIISAFYNNFMLGTGFHPDWFSGDGGLNQWEGADYIFLASIAMYGIVGILLFFPFYLLVGAVIMTFLKLAKKYYKHFYKDKESFLLLIVGIAASSEFIKNIIEYPNWFYPIGAVPDRGKYFIYFGLLLGSYYGLLMKVNNINLKIDDREY